MDIDKVRALNDAELETELSNAKRQLYDLRFQLATRQLTDYSQIPQTRRVIARILTVMTERQLAQADERPAPRRARARRRVGAGR
ncbi:MAG TPA: 50S ribosomal protein L29 [Candidatus Limnocylindrales bacterium]|nr:50S ribosomal protein L29 [Candidatus Limnocylindrales bacterium]